VIGVFLAANLGILADSVHRNMNLRTGIFEHEYHNFIVWVFCVRFGEDFLQSLMILEPLQRRPRAISERLPHV